MGIIIRSPSAVTRAASFIQDINYQGPVIVWSWPSQGWLGGYEDDERAVVWTTPHLIDFFRVLKSQASPAVNLKLDFLAHSMGSRILLQLLFTTHDDVAASSTFAAADADPGEFRSKLSNGIVEPAVVSSTAPLRTLYASAYDRALSASKLYHKHGARAGAGGADILIMSGLDSIEVNLSGHSYVFDHPYALQHFETLFKRHNHASDRGLARLSRGSEFYYVINP
jgi:esterase/lipase superfamily enzyme